MPVICFSNDAADGKAYPLTCGLNLFKITMDALLSGMRLAPLCCCATKMLPKLTSLHPRADVAVQQQLPESIETCCGANTFVQDLWYKEARSGTSMALMRHPVTLLIISLLILAGCADMPVVPDPALHADEFTLDTPIEQLAASSLAASVLRRDIPGLLEDKSYPLFKSMSLRLVGSLSEGKLTPQTLAQTEADLSAVSRASDPHIIPRGLRR